MTIPFFRELAAAEDVLIAGAGGGFDIFCGLPLYFWLRRAGKRVHLANLSFSDLDLCDGESLTRALVKVNSFTNGSSDYFPELHLCQWLREHAGETPIYAIARTGAKPVAAAYERLVATLQPDTILLIDGGTDSLMRGDEPGLGTPEEDVASLAAAHAVAGVARKLLVCLGFGVDTYHGVCHAHYLENVAAITAAGGFLGSWSLQAEMEDFQLYRAAYEYVAKRMPQRPSIVNGSIIAAVQGLYGNAHTTTRTRGSELYINPLMAIYWAFRLETVVSRNLYLDRIADTDNYRELSLAIETYRAGVKTRPWVEIPC